MSPESTSIINHLLAHGPITAEQLCAQFSKMGRRDVLKRCHNLRALGHLDHMYIDKVIHWVACIPVRHVAKPTPTKRPAPVAPVANPADDDDLPYRLPAPRQIDVMFGPTYVPPVTHNHRPGASDAFHIASRGVRC